MPFPRITAAIIVLLLISVVSLISVGSVMLIGPALAHGTNVQHDSGKIVNIGPGTNFELKTSTGTLSFQCHAPQCRVSLGHLQRHLNERANTDVYFTQGPDNTLLVVDVD